MGGGGGVEGWRGGGGGGVGVGYRKGEEAHGFVTARKFN